MASTEEAVVEKTMKEIPGSYGIPLLTPLLNRLEYYYFKGQLEYFVSRIRRFGSTVFRTNMPPGPFIAADPRVIAVLDAKSFRVLFDVSRVDKTDTLYGTFIPSLRFTGNCRVCAYLDPSEQSHGTLKQSLLHFLSSRAAAVVPSFRASFASPLFAKIDADIALNGRCDFNGLSDALALDFVCDAFFGALPPPTLRASADRWLLFLLAPLIAGICRYPPLCFLEDLLLHTLPLPASLARFYYDALLSFVRSAGADPVQKLASHTGLSLEEASHNLLFAAVFNAYGGFKLLLPSILGCLLNRTDDLHARLAAEVRCAVGPAGVVSPAALESMPLVKSVVYEVLRVDPPVRFQYGRARKDFVLESHDAAFLVRKGELIFGDQRFASRDPRVFGPDAGEFVPDRFVDPDRSGKLLRHVLWSNGPETGNPTADNKQCPGKDFVMHVARMFVAELFLRYDSLTGRVGENPLGAEVTLNSVAKPKPKSA